MLNEPSTWRPGSFTKNFAWGPLQNGLLRLHEAIRIAFAGKIEACSRNDAIARLSQAHFTWHIPLNFFLANVKSPSGGTLVVDELVYQALAFEHSQDFDKLALTAFNTSYVGHWNGAHTWQAYPAPWANHYISELSSPKRSWDTSLVSANDIERFVSSDSRFVANDARKLSTNLNYLYLAGRLSEMNTPLITRWWTNAVFLTLDRGILERGEADEDISVARLSQYLSKSGLMELTGPRSRNKDLAIQPLVSLYSACGGLNRWSSEAVRERQLIKLPEINYFANSDDSFYAIYPKDPNIIKSIPRACAMLAKNAAGFEELDAEELTNWNVLEYVRKKTRAALKSFKDRGIKPTMSADELIILTRGE